ncbi:MAG: ATP-binding protein [Fusobacteriaceae bacterium]
MSILQQIRNGESKTLEFKEVIPKGEQIAKTAVAFSNYAGGKILIGVTDKNDIVGIDEKLDIFKIKESLESTLIDSCSPYVNFDIYNETIEEKTIIVIEIFPGKIKPYYLKKDGRENGVYLRIGSSNRKAGYENILELERQRANISYDEEIDYDLSYENLELDFLKKRFLKVGKEITQDKLINMKLIKNHGKEFQATKGLGIILGSYENCEIKCARFKGEEMTYFVDKKEFNGNIFEQIDGVEAFLRNHLNLRSKFVGFQRKDILEIPPLALREAIINAVIHRDYSNQGRDIKVAVYDHIVEITSPGCLPNTLTMEDIYTGRSEIRNKVLAKVFKELDYIEKWGSGLKRINELCREAGVKEPEIRESGDFVSVVFKRMTQQILTEIAPDAHRIPPDAHRIPPDTLELSLSEKNILRIIEDRSTRKDIQEKSKMSDGRVREILRVLQDKKLIEKVGKGPSTFYKSL